MTITPAHPSATRPAENPTAVARNEAARRAAAHAAPLSPRMLPLDADPSLRAHLRRLGPCPVLGRTRLEAELEEAGIDGRGGAGFPLARKIQAMPRRGGIVVVNACEGDPLTHKDTVLVSRSPHLVIDGALVLGQALSARRIVIALHRGAATVALDAALAERDDARRVEILEVDARYVSSQSSAIRSALHGGPALPTDPSVRATDRRPGRPPMLVANAETATLTGLVARIGGQALAAASRGDETGTSLVTVSGDVARPGVLEVRDTDRIGDVLAAAGAGGSARTTGAIGLEPDRPVLTGGATGTWVCAVEVSPLPWGRASLRSVGAERGTGALAVMPEGTCVLAETLEILRFADRASARQCGPCAFGLPSLTADLASLLDGSGGAEALARLRRSSSQISGRGGCAHPTASVATLASALAICSADHLDRHLAGLTCGGSHGTLAALIGDAR